MKSLCSVPAPTQCAKQTTVQWSNRSIKMDQKRNVNVILFQVLYVTHQHKWPMRWMGALYKGPPGIMLGLKEQCTPLPKICPACWQHKKYFLIHYFIVPCRLQISVWSNVDLLHWISLCIQTATSHVELRTHISIKRKWYCKDSSQLSSKSERLHMHHRMI